MKDNYYLERDKYKIKPLPELKHKYGDKMGLFTDCKNCDKNYYGHIISCGCNNYEPKLI